MSQFDVVGVGLNATDTLILAPHFPAYAGKMPFVRELASPGGQVATALVTCARLGLSTKYIGTVGDDERGRIQLESLRETAINLDDVEVRENCPNQTAYILIDQSTGERTILWRRDDCLRLDPARITPEKIAGARLLHIDGHDTAAVARAAEIARQNRIPVTVDVDTIYPGFDRVLPNVDFVSAEHTVRTGRDRSPLELGLGWLVDFNKGHFTGRRALLTERAQGSRRRLVGLDIAGNKPAHNSLLYTDDTGKREIGSVTSAAWSPTCKRNIALAIVDAPHFQVGATVWAEIYLNRELVWERRMSRAQIVERPFFAPERRRATPPAEF